MSVDLYRYFHPHHNPRLRTTPLRLQEIGELEQAARELKRAIERAEVRTPADAEDIKKNHFHDLASVLDHVVDVLTLMQEIHPGDRPETILRIVDERRNLPGWERWADLVTARIRDILPDL